MISTEHKSAVGWRNTQFIKLSLQVHQIVHTELNSLGRRIRGARRYQYRSLGGVLIGTERMGSLGILGVIECVGTTLLDTSHLVVTQGVQFVIGDWNNLCLEFIEREGLVSILELLDFDRICLVINQHLRVCTDIHHVNYVIIHDRTLIRHTYKPGSIQIGTQSPDKLARPYFFKNACVSRTLWHKRSCCDSDKGSNSCTPEWIISQQECNESTHNCIEQQCCKYFNQLSHIIEFLC